ncbi:MAG: hypothetical protein AAB502_03970, partial [Chloroflexota bacterium]
MEAKQAEKRAEDLYISPNQNSEGQCNGEKPRMREAGGKPPERPRQLQVKLVPLLGIGPKHNTATGLHGLYERLHPFAWLPEVMQDANAKNNVENGLQGIRIQRPLDHVDVLLGKIPLAALLNGPGEIQPHHRPRSKTLANGEPSPAAASHLKNRLAPEVLRLERSGERHEQLLSRHEVTMVVESLPLAAERFGRRLFRSADAIGKKPANPPFDGIDVTRPGN